MIGTIALGLAAGFCAGNGLPYYVMGSTGDAIGPGPFRPSATANVLSGWVLIVAAAVCWHYTDTQAHRLPTYAAAAAGVLLVGLIHARLWRTDPWGRTRERTLPEGRQA
ncbi:hypothetical protein ACIO53_25870 [Streptomyces sp. NPDC087305]|uniref:hypothetical protein n=1 Tax=Streptomyces sp. NPDC087305 TaxID=3365781 RepID=UPI003804CF4F